MGDRCLKAIAGVLQKIQTPGQVFCARYGGDEFMIVYTGMTVEQIRRISEDILREVRMLKYLMSAAGAVNTYPSARESLQESRWKITESGISLPERMSFSIRQKTVEETASVCPQKSPVISV